MRIYKNFKESNSVTLFNGDCRKLLKRLPDESVDLVVTSPPYCIGKAYEDPHDDIETFRKQHQDIFSDLYRVVKPGGSICWQIGYHVSDKCVSKLLSVISINGFIIALTRQLSINGVNDFDFYDRIFNGWTIDFSKDGFKYTSSQYRKFSTQILREAFQISDEIVATI